MYELHLNKACLKKGNQEISDFTKVKDYKFDFI